MAEQDVSDVACLSPHRWAPNMSRRYGMMWCNNQTLHCHTSMLNTFILNSSFNEVHGNSTWHEHLVMTFLTCLLVSVHVKLIIPRQTSRSRQALREDPLWKNSMYINWLAVMLMLSPNLQSHWYLLESALAWSAVYLFLSVFHAFPSLLDDADLLPRNM